MRTALRSGGAAPRSAVAGLGASWPDNLCMVPPLSLTEETPHPLTKTAAIRARRLNRTIMFGQLPQGLPDIRARNSLGNLFSKTPKGRVTARNSASLAPARRSPALRPSSKPGGLDLLQQALRPVLRAAPKPSAQEPARNLHPEPKGVPRPSDSSMRVKRYSFYPNKKMCISVSLIHVLALSKGAAGAFAVDYRPQSP